MNQIEKREERNENKMSKVFFLELDSKIGMPRYDSFMKFISKEKQCKLSRFHFETDKKLGLVSELLVRLILCQNLRIKNDELIFATTALGKPYIINDSDLHFNISHTKNAIAVAIGNHPIGVDVESIDSYDEDIAERFFCIGEKEYIHKKNEGIRERFCEIWTMKEAYMKWIGKGFYMSLDSFDVINEKLDCSFKSFTRKSYIISVCEKSYNSEDCMVEFIEIQEKDLYDRLYTLV